MVQTSVDCTKSIIKKIFWCSKRRMLENVCINAEKCWEFFRYEEAEKMSRSEQHCPQSCKQAMGLLRA